MSEFLQSRYGLEQEIGSGGIGMVYRASDARTGATVAVKILHPDLARDREYVRRFHRGARIAAGLQSPHIVQVLDEGEDNGQHYLVMEFVAGGTLTDRLGKRGRLPEQEARRIVRDVALALQDAEKQGVVHRDISPGNILLTEDGTAKVTDFDIARAEDATRMTSTGLFMGKVGYAAPETYAGKADIRSDLYSLGILLYEMLTGRAPFEAETPLAVMDMHRSVEPPGLTELPARRDRRLGLILQRLLAKRSEQRFQTPTELLEALEGRLDETLLAPFPRRVTPQAQPVSTRRPFRTRLSWPRAGSLVLVGGALIVVLGVVLTSLNFDGGAASEQQSPGAASLLPTSVLEMTRAPGSDTPEITPPTVLDALQEARLSPVEYAASELARFPMPSGFQPSYASGSDDTNCHEQEAVQIVRASYSSPDTFSREELLEFYLERPEAWTVLEIRLSESFTNITLGRDNQLASLREGFGLLNVDICTLENSILTDSLIARVPDELDARLGTVPVPGNARQTVTGYYFWEVEYRTCWQSGMRAVKYLAYDTAALSRDEVADFYRRGVDGWLPPETTTGRLLLEKDGVGLNVTLHEDSERGLQLALLLCVVDG